MKKATLLITAILLVAALGIKAQVAVSTDGSNAHPSAMLEVKSTQKGFLLPRMTQAERNLIASPAAGLVVWCTNCGNNGEMQLFNGTAWTNMTGGTAAIPWICGAGFTDSRDGKTYSTVLIGTQCWMAQNLNVGTRINGSGNQNDNSSIEKYCYGDNESNCDIYGGLYQWNEMMQYSTTPGIKGICPNDWHLPTHAEWTVLTNYLGGTIVAGGKMKETGTTHWISPNTGATNSSGFAAFPGGNRYHTGAFTDISQYGYFWSSTGVYSNSAWVRYLYYSTAEVLLQGTDKTLGLNVRCLHD
jgi:uncharacterized protein (TIGR02145 family)